MLKLKYFFNTQVTCFLKNFCAKLCEILTSGPREMSVFQESFFAFNRNFFSYYPCAASAWVLSVTKKNLRIAGFFALLPLLTFLSNETIKP